MFKNQILSNPEIIRILQKPIPTLGKAERDSPFASLEQAVAHAVQFVDETERVLATPYLSDNKAMMQQGITPLSYELAGPRRKIYFDSSKAKAAIVTCGGLCPGLNDVIRGLALTLAYAYGVKDIYGIRYGYRGMVDGVGEPPLMLKPEEIEPISNEGGSFLGTSRGNQDPMRMLEFLKKHDINMLFCIGGDGTQKGALAISDAAIACGYPLSVVGIPKTVDNDIALVEKTFGFDTAVAVANEVLRGAHVEANAERNGVVIVKLMGRESGFLATHAAIASGDVNFLLIPEVPFDLEGEQGFLAALRSRLEKRHHALVVVAEGVAEKLLAKPGVEAPTDASGNRILEDVGIYLKNFVSANFKKIGFDAKVRYIDPSYVVRSLRANSLDSIYCQSLAHNAAHAAMAGRTRVLVAACSHVYCHIPLEGVALGRKYVDPDGPLWRSAVETTGQPSMLNSPAQS